MEDKYKKLLPMAVIVSVNLFLYNQHSSLSAKWSILCIWSKNSSGLSRGTEKEGERKKSFSLESVYIWMAEEQDKRTTKYYIQYVILMGEEKRWIIAFSKSWCK